VLTKRFKATAAQVDVIAQLRRDQTVIPKPAALLSLKVRDPDDAWVLASAVVGGADLLVSGDQDLIVLANRAPLPILSPRDAWSRLRGEGAV
jgi:putative PIN family toxin of toxin-antitoxin system